VTVLELPPGRWRRGDPIPHAGMADLLLDVLGPMLDEPETTADPARGALLCGYICRIVTADNPDDEASRILGELLEHLHAVAAFVALLGEEEAEVEDPDNCWRCNAVKVDDPLGVCPACLNDLRVE
jgi:hypothetical protein